MKLINSEYHVLDSYENLSGQKAYIVEQLDKPGEKYCLEILDSYNHQKEIADYVENILFYQGIKSSCLVSTMDFGRMDTINLQPVSGDRYYVISEFVGWDTLDSIWEGLDPLRAARIIIGVMEALDYLHFRGLSYDVLNPSFIFVSPSDKVKLLDYPSAIHSKFNHKVLEMMKGFISREIFSKDRSNGNNPDLWSLGILVEKLFRQNTLDYVQGEFIAEIVAETRFKNYDYEDSTLSNLIEGFNEMFQVGHKREVLKERQKLQFDIKQVRMADHLGKIRLTEPQNKVRDKRIKGIYIFGNRGTGKTRYVNELKRREKLKGRKIYLIDINKAEVSSIDDLKAFLIQFCDQLKIINSIKSESNSFEITLNNMNKIYNLDYLSEKFDLYNTLSEELAKDARNSMVFLCLVNIHRADMEILNFIDFLISKSLDERVFFVLASNHDSIKDKVKKNRIDQWIKNENLKELELKNLSRSEAYEFMRSTLGNNNVPEGFMGAIYRESMGNPKYILSLLQHFLDNRMLFINREGKWETSTKDYSSLKYPTTFRDALYHKVQELNEVEILFLKLLSCFDYPAVADILNEILKLEESSYYNLIDRLRDIRILSVLKDGDNTLSFSEGELKRLIYNEIPIETRKTYHEEIAGILIGRRNDNEIFNFESLIQHLSDSDQHGFMVEIILERIGKEVNKFNDNSVNLLTMCYENLKGSGHPATMTILQQLIEGLMTQGRFSTSKEYIKSYLDLASTKDSIEDIITSELMKLEILIRANELSEISDQVERCEVLVRQSNKPEFKINLLRLKGIHKQILDMDQDSLSDLEAALELAIESGFHEFDGDIYNLQGICHYHMGDHEKAIDSYNKAIDMYVVSKRPFDKIKPLNNIGNIYNEVTGDHNKALDYYFRCLAVSEENGLSSFQTTFLNNISETCLTMGMYEKAEEYIDESIELSHINGDRISEFLGWVYSGTLALARQNLKEASLIFLKIRELNKAEPIIEKETAIQYMDFLSRFYMELGDYHLGKLFSRNGMDKAADVNPKMYVRFRGRILIIDTISKKQVNSGSIEVLVKEFDRYGLEHDKARFLIEMMHVCHYLRNQEVKEFLEAKFSEMEDTQGGKRFSTDLKILRLLNDGGDESLRKATGLLADETLELSQTSCRYFSDIGRLFHEKGDYKRSSAYLLKSMDLIQTRISQVKIDGYVEKTWENYNIESIIEMLREALLKGFGIKSGHIELDKSRKSIVGKYISLLTRDQYDYLFTDREKNGASKDIKDLLSRFSSDYGSNIQESLEFLLAESGAETGEVVIFGAGKSDENQIKAGDSRKNHPINPVVLDILKSGESLILNRGNENTSTGLHADYTDSEVRGLIGVPIIEPVNKSMDEGRRTKRKKDKVYGYISLQTDSEINRFGKDVMSMVKSISTLIYMNIENQKLHLSSNYDTLTGVLSRESVENNLLEVIHDSNCSTDEFSVLMMDIDRFKSVNDSYGHQVGDQILKSIGGILTETIRQTDHCGRYGGEEFLIVLENINIENTMKVAEEIRKAISGYRGFPINNKVTVSIGISHYPDHGNSKEDLIYKADQSLYYAKEILGRDKTACWDMDMEEIGRMNNLTHNLSMEVFNKNHNQLESLIDMSLIGRTGKSYEDKIFVFLGAINESIGAEKTTILIKDENGEFLQYARLRSSNRWTEGKKIPFEAISEVLISKEYKVTIDWEGITTIQGNVDISNLNSMLLVPVIINEKVKAIICSEVRLGNKDFTDSDAASVEVLGGVFAINLV